MHNGKCGLKNGNSVSDLPRLEDAVERWEELHDLSRVPPERSEQ